MILTYFLDFFFLVLNPLLDIQFASIFTYSVGCLFISLTDFCKAKETFSLMWSLFLLLFPLSEGTSAKNIAKTYVRVD